MPKQPFQISEHIQNMSKGVYTKFSKDLAAMKGQIYPLHVGDTYLEPVKEARIEEIKTSLYQGVHKYTLPQGLPDLVHLLAKEHNVDPNQILVTPGATSGISVLATATLEPDDEVLILAPFWPLVGGIVKGVHAKVVLVPFWDRLEEFRNTENVSQNMISYISQFLSERTVAIYINTPNNPTGQALDLQEMETLVQLAKDHNLAIWADEVYEKITYDIEHYSAVQLAPERTVGIYSFSKQYGMAGNRCGYLIFPSSEIMEEVRKASTIAFYSTPTASQFAAVQAILHGANWLQTTRDAYREVGYQMAEIFGVSKPQGSTFLFLDVSDALDDEGVDGLLAECIRHNVVLAPGSSFGTDYKNYIRICFTSAPPQIVLAGARIVQDILMRRRERK